MGVALYNYAEPVRKAAAKLDSPVWETLKAIGRFVLAMFIAILVKILMDRVDVIPEFYCSTSHTASCIPVRMYVAGSLGSMSWILDKYLFETYKHLNGSGITKGLFPF